MSCETETSPTSDSTSEPNRLPPSSWTLAFSNRALEHDYMMDRARRSVPVLRVGGVVLLLFTVGFGVFFIGLGHLGEYIDGFGRIPTSAVVGMVLALIAFLGFIALVGQRAVWPWLQPLTFAFALVWFGADVPSLGELSLPYTSTMTLGALIIAYGILRLRFIYASVLGWSVVIVHGVLAAAQHPASEATINQIAINGVLTASMNAILMVAAYQLEAADRAAFWGLRQTERRAAELRNALVELTEAESRLIETEREASQSRLVAGLLHEINNPTAVLRSNLQIWDRLQQKLRTADARADTEQLRRLLEQTRPVGQAVSTSARRVTTALKGLETFVGLDAGAMVRVDVVDGLREAARLVHAQRSVDIAVDAPDTPVEVHAHRYRINQVWLQLLDNAARAVGPGGRVEARVHPVDAVDDQVVVEIADRGPGIDPSTLATVFEVGFFDVDGRVQFRLGLPLSRRVVEEHGGRLELESTVGEGTIARVRLPRTAASAHSA